MTALNNSDTQNDQFKSFVNKVSLSRLVLLILVIILTILGNTLVLFVTWKERAFHQPNKYFIACLAIADLLVGIVSGPILFYHRLNQLKRDETVSTPVLCHFHTWIDAFAETASIYTLTFISFDRYLKISKPLHYKSRMTTSTSLKVIFIIFLISIVYASFSIFPVKPCYTFDKIYYTFIAVAAFCLPIIVMMIMYAMIFLVVHKRKKMLQNGELGQKFNDRNQRTGFLQDLKLIRMLVIVVGVFIFCWGPFFIWLLLFLHETDLLHNPKKRKLMFTIESIIFTLPLINSLCNPIIYACLDQKYKEAFKHLFQELTSWRRPISRSQEPPNVIELRNYRQPKT